MKKNRQKKQTGVEVTARFLWAAALIFCWVLPTHLSAAISGSVSKITAIDIWQTDAVVHLRVQTDSPVEVKTTRRGPALIAVFQNAGSDVSFGEYTPNIFPFSTIKLQKSRAHQGVIGLTVTFDEKLQNDARVQTEEKQLLVSVAADDARKSSHWSAGVETTKDTLEKTIGAGEKVKNDAQSSSAENPVPEKKQDETDRQDNARKISYKVYGRDPFIPLNREDMAQGELPDVENLKLVGVLYDKDEQVALFEDLSDNNKPYAMRERDKVRRGRVFRIQEESVVFLLYESGIAHTFTLKLHNKQDNQ